MEQGELCELSLEFCLAFIVCLTLKESCSPFDTEAAAAAAERGLLSSGFVEFVWDAAATVGGGADFTTMILYLVPSADDTVEVVPGCSGRSLGIHTFCF